MTQRLACLVLALLVIGFCARQVLAQEAARYGESDFYVGYGFLSNSFNDYSGFSGTPMNGWDASLEMYNGRSVGLKINAMGFYGTNLGASQTEHSILAGPAWSRRLGRETMFAHGLVGLGFINKDAIPFDLSSASSTTTFAALAGGGVDRYFSQRVAWRLEADFLRSQYGSKSDQIHGLHGNFAHFTTGVVFRF